MVLGMEESYHDRTADFTYAAEDAYTARLKREPGKMPLDNRAARVFEERYRPARFQPALSDAGRGSYFKRQSERRDRGV